MEVNKPSLGCETMKVIQTRTKLEVIGVVILLMGVSSAWAVQRIISSDNDNLATFLISSNGDSYISNNSNLQFMVFNLNSTGGGEITIPVGEITITTPVRLPDYVSITGYGSSSVLKLGDNANVSVFVNFDPTNGNKDIKITNLKIDGNGGSHGPFAASAPGTRPNAINFINVDNATIDNCVITQSPSAAVFWRQVNNSKITDSTLSYSGIQFFGTGRHNHIPKGFFGEGCLDNEFDNLFIHNCFASGFSPEAQFGAGTLNSTRWTLSNTIIHNCSDGIYLERTKDGIISNVFTYDNHNEETYETEEPDGIVIGTYCENITLIGVHSYRNGNISGAKGHGFQVSGGAHDLVFIGCKSYDNFEKGFNILSDNTSMYTCDAWGNGDDGIYTESENSIITGCKVSNNGDKGIYCSDLEASDYFILSNNIVTGNGGEGDFAIKCTAPNAIVSGNTVQSPYGVGIDITGDNISITNNIINNTGNDVGDASILLETTVSNGTVIGNYVYNGIGNGIQLASCNSVHVQANTIHSCNRGIIETGTADYNIIVMNDCRWNDNGNNININGNTIVNCTGLDEWNWE